MLYTDISKGSKVAKDPAVVKYKDSYYMYYSTFMENEQGMSEWGIGIAKSKDLEEWEKVDDLHKEGVVEKNGICAPGAMIYDGAIHLFYQTYGNFERDAICHAVSTDGVHFIRNETNPILRAEGEWNNGRAIDADVCIFNNALFLYFATRDPQGIIQMQGVSRCPLDGQFHRESWQQLCNESILKPELNWEQECIEAAATIVRDNKVYMFYAGAYNNKPQQVGVAVSEDGIHFERVYKEPILANGKPGTWNACESGHPYIFEDDDGKIYLFYQGNNDKGRTWYLSKEEVKFVDGMPVIVGQKR